MNDHTVYVGEDRRHTTGLVISRKQIVVWLISFLSFVTTTQLSVNYFAIKAWVRSESSEIVKNHNDDQTAHAAALLAAAGQRADIMTKLVALDTKLEGIERMLTVIAENGGFNIVPRKNGNRK
jgi:hypothetical protein